MTKQRHDGAVAGKISRREAIAATGICFAMMSRKALATAGTPPSDATQKSTYTKESEAHGMVEVTAIHAGKGKGKVRLFRFDGAPAPAHFLIYDLPPGASEGVHVHYLDNRNQEGSFDEYYYFISGHGQMEIDGKIVAVTKGDHVHTPLTVAHGVENTHPTENLRVFLTFIKRGDEQPRMSGASPGPAATP